MGRKKRRGVRHVIAAGTLGQLNSFSHQLHVTLLQAGHAWRGWKFENVAFCRRDHLCGHIAHAPRRAVSLFFNVVGHNTIMLVNDVGLETVALAVLNPTSTTNIGSLPCNNVQKLFDQF